MCKEGTKEYTGTTKGDSHAPHLCFRFLLECAAIFTSTSLVKEETKSTLKL